jgi:pilus assembly protein CpaF
MDLLTRIAYEHPELAELDEAARRLALRDLSLSEAGRPLFAGVEMDAGALADEIDGWGPLTQLMRDPGVTDILVNGPGDVRVERSGAIEPAGVCFRDREHLQRSVQRWIGRAGGRADASSPVADVRLGDGSRLHVVLPPVAPHGPLVSIRRFPRCLGLEDLVEAGAVTESEAAWLRTAVTARRTIAIAGATGSGKTTLLSALLAEVPQNERVVTIEEVPEIATRGGHIASLVTRPSNVQGVGAVTLRDLVRASLRMRPDRIVVGEVRGAETLDALDAFASGHRGSMITLHASSATAIPSRMTALARHAPEAPDASALNDRVGQALDVVLFLEKVDGSRRVTFIGELDADGTPRRAGE